MLVLESGGNNHVKENEGVIYQLKIKKRESKLIK